MNNDTQNTQLVEDMEHIRDQFERTAVKLNILQKEIADLRGDFSKLKELIEKV
ncbi:MAG: hypothetical protein JXR95_05210 [Deltaproteobacteria bacterium]|nr:hypothetical protein [Deltaproteobacteria bacterium]